VLKRSSGGKIMGSGWNGRACWAKMSVARRALGTGFSEKIRINTAIVEVRLTWVVSEACMEVWVGS
jgi:hypothetical protein